MLHRDAGACDDPEACWCIWAPMCVDLPMMVSKALASVSLKGSSHRVPAGLRPRAQGRVNRAFHVVQQCSEDSDPLQGQKVLERTDCTQVRPTERTHSWVVYASVVGMLCVACIKSRCGSKAEGAVPF